LGSDPSASSPPPGGPRSRLRHGPQRGHRGRLPPVAPPHRHGVPYRPGLRAGAAPRPATARGVLGTSTEANRVALGRRCTHQPTPRRHPMKPTIVLVHGAFAESASWNAVIDILHANDQPVIAASNPLRGLASDAETVSDLVRSIDGPVVLAGHSYGGAVITNVDPDAGDIVGLAYVAAFAPAAGEDCISLSQQYPGSTLGEALRPVPRHDGTTDL